MRPANFFSQPSFFLFRHAALLAVAICGLTLCPPPATRAQGSEASNLTGGSLTIAGGSSSSTGNVYTLGSTTTLGTVTTVIPPSLSYWYPAFFTGTHYLNNGVYYLTLPNGNPFGYYAYLGPYSFTVTNGMFTFSGGGGYIYHFDMGYEYVTDAGDAHDGVYFYDFASKTFFYTSPSFPFPYLYDFNLNTVLYYYPDPASPGHYNTNGVRYFYRFDTGQIITK